MSKYCEDYLEMIKKHVDPDALIDSKGNVVYVDQHVIAVSPEDCKQIMNEMCGVDEYD